MTAPAQPEAGSEAETERDGPRRKRRVLVRRRKVAEAGRPTDKPEERPQETALRRDRLRNGVSPGERKPSPPEAGQVSAASPREGSRKPYAPEGPAPRRVDVQARKEFAEIQNGRRSFLKKTAIGAGILALGASLGYGGGLAQATGLSGNTRTVITDTEIAARVIAGVRIASEFIPDPVPAGTDADPYPGSAIQAALNDGVPVYIPSGTWKLTSPITRGIDNVTIIGAGKSTRLLLDGVTPVISAGTQVGWLMANLATDAGGVDISGATECRFTEIWVNGTLTDNRPIAVGGGGAGGYYGVRAEDYITFGDGSPTNPYNASAIQAAINALGSMGGIVFIKKGIWRGTSRIQVPSTTSPTNARYEIHGEGVDLSEYGDTGAQNDLQGTQVQAGFDIYCPTDIYDIDVTPHPNNFNTQPSIKIVLDSTRVPNSGPASQGYSGVVGRWIGGFTMRRVKVRHGDPGIWLTGQNLGNDYYWQMWNVVMDQISIVQGKRGIKIEKGDSTLSSGFRGRIENVIMHSLTGGRGFDFGSNGPNSTSAVFGQIMFEGVGTASDDYAFYVRTYGDPSVYIYNIDFGDGSNAAKDAYLWIGRGGHVQNLMYVKDVDIGGRGYFRIGGYRTTTANFNILSGYELTVEERAGSDRFAVGVVDSSSDAKSIRIVRAPGNQTGYLGSTTPSGSPFTYTNQDMCDEVVYITGGAVTGVTRSGQSVGTELAHSLAPGDAIIIAYTSAPTIKRFAVSR